MSALLQGVLRNTIDDDPTEEELVGVVSLPGTPRPSSPSPRSRQTSPSRSPRSSLANGAAKSKKSVDPLRTLPTEVSQRIFGMLTMKDLGRCALVCKKWGRSQTLNYVWFQHYRKDNFHDESLPPGKWTKRESKVNWRTTHLTTLRQSAKNTLNGVSNSGYATPSYSSGLGSGYQTPRELKEAQWKADADVSRPGKNEMREMYKEMGGRKVIGKGGNGGKGDRRGVKDKAGVGWD